MRYSAGFMLGGVTDRHVRLDTQYAFGHLLRRHIHWADPQRDIPQPDEHR
jgi:hypothetical protein